MEIKSNIDANELDSFFRYRLPDQEIKSLIQAYAQPYRELMSYYRCAMMEESTKFNVLNEELSLQYDRNPIETIKTMNKSVDSIVEKLRRQNYLLNLTNIEEKLNDIAGVRVICSFPSDIYQLADAFLRQADILLINRKDYIRT